MTLRGYKNGDYNITASSLKAGFELTEILVNVRSESLWTRSHVCRSTSDLWVTAEVSQPLSCEDRKVLGAASERRSSRVHVRVLTGHRLLVFLQVLQILQHLLDQRRHGARDLHLQGHHPLGSCTCFIIFVKGRRKMCGKQTHRLIFMDWIITNCFVWLNKVVTLEALTKYDLLCDKTGFPWPLALMLRRSVIFMRALGNMRGMLGRRLRE